MNTIYYCQVALNYLGTSEANLHIHVHIHNACTHTQCMYMDVYVYTTLYSCTHASNRGTFMELYSVDMAY